MNCPSRTEDDLDHPGWNQNPPTLAADLTTRQDLNGIVNTRTQLDTERDVKEDDSDKVDDGRPKDWPACSIPPPAASGGRTYSGRPTIQREQSTRRCAQAAFQSRFWKTPSSLQHLGRILVKYSKFVGPGFMVAVAYIDPGNYSTDVAAGAAKRFKLLFIVLMSNVFAILLQSLAVRLGTVTGLNLAEHCRAHLPRWLNISLYVLGEGAIIATDIAEVRY